MRWLNFFWLYFMSRNKQLRLLIGCSYIVLWKIIVLRATRYLSRFGGRVAYIYLSKGVNKIIQSVL